MCFFCLLPDLHFVRLHCSHDCWAHRLVWKICWSSRSFIGDDENWEKTHYKHLATAVSWIIINDNDDSSSSWPLQRRWPIPYFRIFSASPALHASSASLEITTEELVAAHVKHSDTVACWLWSLSVCDWWTWSIGHWHNHNVLNLFLLRHPTETWQNGRPRWRRVKQATSG